MRIATENVIAEVEEEGGVVERQVAVAGQPVPEAYAHLVPESKTTAGPNEMSPVTAAPARERVEGGSAEPERGYGPTEEARASAAKGARKSGGKD